jgi:hypothetical protein
VGGASAIDPAPGTPAVIDCAGSTPGRRTPKVVLQEAHWMRRRGGVSATTANLSLVPHPGHVTLNDEGEAKDCWLILDRLGRFSKLDFLSILPRLLPLPAAF